MVTNLTDTPRTPETSPHEYEPGDTASAMHTDALCKVCGGPKRSSLHGG